MGKIRLAIVGVGNCASSLIQGVYYYRNAKEGEFVPGLMHVVLGGYHVSDIEPVAAFDVDKNKVGKDLADALLSPPNNTIQFATIPKTGVIVQRGLTLDGIGRYYKETIEESDEEPVDVAAVLREREVDVLVNYLPVGSEEATRWYAEQALKAGCAFVNCMPAFIAKDKKWQERYQEAGLPIVGDDIKSQVGATITHRVLTKLFNDRGVKLERTYQLNVGGNMDFKNMLEKGRLVSKRISKTDAVVSQLDYELHPDNVYIGPSDYVPWLTDRKICFLRMEGTAFGGVPLVLDLRLEVWDSPNSAGVAIDAIRCAKIGLDRGISGPLYGPSAYFMKSPPIQYPDPVAREMTEAFIEGR
ncbi:TPA: inositol-3-phosphate synthase [Candidatus Poribacteria bacterium]|nr:inositol-3-phosphate synthase [Candidatus Poribacteria bacterium]